MLLKTVEPLYDATKTVVQYSPIPIPVDIRIPIILYFGETHLYGCYAP